MWYTESIAMARAVAIPMKRLWAHVSDHTKYRLLEMVPGVLVWTTFALALFLSFFKPLWAIYFIIIFDLYWLFRVVYVLIYLVMAYRKFRYAVRVDWLARVERLPNWRRLYHLVFLPTAGEPLAVLRTSFQALVECSYPKDRMIVVLGIEERKGEQARANAAVIQEEFGSVFGKLLVTEHPDGLPGELAGKGANLAWSGREVQRTVDTELRIPYDDIVVSAFDVDAQVHPQYFSYLAYQYLTSPSPTRTSYQPVPLYNNNLWQSPAIMRVAANSTTFWLMTEQVRPERLFTFSSHSMSFRALVDVGFWQNDLVTEDSRIFLQCLLRYDGDYRVTPMYIPVSMDTVAGTTLWRSFVNLYKQQRRWAYGVENFPYMIWNFAKNPLISARAKARYVFNQLEGVYSWATAPILIFVLGRLPLIAGRKELESSIAAQNAPAVLQLLMSVAMIGLILCAVLSTTLLPARPKGQPRAKALLMVLQWVLFPISMIVFGSFPATDAQTRLMLGKYLGFWVTEKHRS